MAVVENAADGLSALSMPNLGLGRPLNFAHIASESSQLQLQHHHYLHHHLHQHQPLLHQHHNSTDDAEKGQQGGTLVEMDGIVDAELVSTLQTSEDTSIDGIPSRFTSNCGITSDPTLCEGGFSEVKSLTNPNQELGRGQKCMDGAEFHSDSKALSSSTVIDPTQNAASVLTSSGDGNAPRLSGKMPSPTTNVDLVLDFKKESTHKMEDLLFKLNPLAKEFVPSSSPSPDACQITDNSTRKKKNGYPQGGRNRGNGRTSKAQREESIRRTVYVSDIDQQVTEKQLAALFYVCGPVVDCRVCGDPNSVLRFAFVEFTNEAGARAALSLAGTMLGYYPVKVLPSKTAIVPVNPTFLPRSEDEREMCARTVYCTNIDKKVSQADVRLFFEKLCGEVSRLRLLGDYRHSTRIAFVEFVLAESAMAALNCSGSILGSLPLRVSPSKTPVRPRSSRLL